ncbi:MAG: type II CAAX endopeptidase family protein [Planctomycetota bacterium]
MSAEDGAELSSGGRAWPAGRAIPDGLAVAATCAGCATAWRVHQNLAGFRFACDVCGGWVTVPEVPRGALQQAGAAPQQLAASHALTASGGDLGVPTLEAARRPVSEQPRDADGLVRLDLPSGVTYRGELAPDLPLAPGALRHAGTRARQRWSARATLEIAAMFLALVAPFTVASLLLTGDDAALLLPFCSLVGGVAVLLIGLLTPHYTFGALRGAAPRYFAEAAVVAAGFLALAFLWSQALESWTGLDVMEGLRDLRVALGTPILIAVIAAAPALFEELAFRGLLQARLAALMGLRTGIFATTALFALAHGISVGSPMHLALGLYLGFLRERSGSLVPGMLVHFLYNGALVLDPFGPSV